MSCFCQNGVLILLNYKINVAPSFSFVFTGTNVSYYMDTGDGTTYNMSNHFNESVFNSSNYTVFGSYNVFFYLVYTVINQSIV